ncbi:MAG: ATPase domain-containing protein [Candidatus Woesearchaeota archaeon]
MVREIITDKNQINRIKTYVEGFDEHLQGGIPEGHIVLVSGVAGTMKSSFVFNVLYNEALNGRVCMYVSLEQSYTSLINHMVNMDFKMDKVNLVILSDISKINEAIAQIDENKGALIITDLSSIRKQVKQIQVDSTKDWLNVIKNIVKKVKDKAKCDLFCLDSMSALYVLSNFDDARTKLFHVFEFLRDLEITSFLISEMPLSKHKYSEYEVEDYLADGIIVLDLARHQRKVSREIAVVKMRGTDCNHDIFTLEFKDGKFHALYGGKIPLI